MKDIVGFYRTRTEADQVRDELLSAGFDRDDITLYDRTGKDESNLWEEIKSAFGFAHEDDQRIYAEATRRGLAAVGLSLDHDDSAQQAIQIMQKHRPVDLDTEAGQWKAQGWTDQQAQTTTRPATPQAQAARPAQSGGKQVIPVVEEQVQVGKERVQQGGVRVYTRVTEKPVQEQVTLREERVNVERRRVDRPLTDADKPFQERTVEVTQSAERPVVNKQARVVEEVVIGKDVQERTETVRDTARRTDVNVEKMGPDSELADRYAQELNGEARYRGKDWSAIESDAGQNFERRYPGRKWDQFKDAVGRGYQRLTSKSA